VFGVYFTAVFDGGDEGFIGLLHYSFIATDISIR